MNKKSDKDVKKPQPPTKPSKQLHLDDKSKQLDSKPSGVKGWLLRWINRLIEKYSKFN